MLLIYNLCIKLYFILIFFASLFSKKAKKWLNGRQNANFVPLQKSVWFHFASLGEFEQGRPVLEKLRAKAGLVIVVTFFSPSGFEVRKNTPLADYVYYLPLDTAANARLFIDTINPTLAIFTKYEYWYHYFNVLHQKKVPLYIVSGIFRPGQVFFKWYGSLHRKMLGFVTTFFVQDEASRTLLAGVGMTDVLVSGDTRFDRVWENALTPQAIDLVFNFKGNQPVFIAGSTWPEDEKLITRLVALYPDWKFIIAQHEITEEKISSLMTLLPAGQSIRYSQVSAPGNDRKISGYRVLVIDNIGMLASLYQYADVAYIGGGFGAGIHNTLEAAAFGLPVIFGPKYEKFKEARDMVANHSAFVMRNFEELQAITDKLLPDKNYRTQFGTLNRQYVENNVGATGVIMGRIKEIR